MCFGSLLRADILGWWHFRLGGSSKQDASPLESSTGAGIKDVKITYWRGKFCAAISRLHARAGTGRCFFLLALRIFRIAGRRFLRRSHKCLKQIKSKCNKKKNAKTLAPLDFARLRVILPK
jgi:hypothetical protein